MTLTDDPANAQEKVASIGFDFVETAAGTVRISYLGRQVTTLAGPAAERFLRRVRGSSDAEAQQLMARATGQFKRGNEKRSKQSRH